jgi:hypothetical protein
LVNVIELKLAISPREGFCGGSGYANANGKAAAFCQLDRFRFLQESYANEELA